MAGMSLAAALGDAGIETVVIEPLSPDAMTDRGFDGRTTAIAAGSRTARRFLKSAFPTAIRRFSCITITARWAMSRSGTSSRTAFSGARCWRGSPTCQASPCWPAAA